MPWYNNITGELVKSPSDDDKQKDELIYRPSIYAKEELPTWAEVYEEFYLGKIFDYDPDNPDHQTKDPYWNIPHRKYLLATVCNQFNKMLFEDQEKDKILSKLSDKFHTKMTGLCFVCRENWLPVDDVLNFTPSIYTFPMPNGKTNPFITSNNKRIDISKMTGYICIDPVYIYDIPSDHRDEFANINNFIDIMMDQYKSYFNGDIGWKDHNGKLIDENISCRDCTGAGYRCK